MIEDLIGRLENTFLILPLIGDMSFVSGLRPLLELVMPPVLGLVAILRGLALLANWDTSPTVLVWHRTTEAETL